MLSRPVRAPSGVTQLHESPCWPPVDWMTKCRAFAGGFASSDAGTCANRADDAASDSESETTFLLMPMTRRLSASDGGFLLNLITCGLRVHRTIRNFGIQNLEFVTGIPKFQIPDSATGGAHERACESEIAGRDDLAEDLVDLA